MGLILFGIDSSILKRGIFFKTFLIEIKVADSAIFFSF